VDRYSGGVVSVLPGGSAEEMMAARNNLKRPDANTDTLAMLRAQMLEEARKMAAEKTERVQVIITPHKYHITLQIRYNAA
jgi:hypothetical protein